MAISRTKKQALVADMSDKLAGAKLTVFAGYSGLSVADLQDLRRLAREAKVTITVIKNRLVKVALTSNATYKDVDTTKLSGQLLYATAGDEVAPAQVLDKFSKDHPELTLVGAFSGDGANLNTDEVKALASLPGKNQLIAEVISQLLSPVHDVTGALSGNLHALLDGVSAKATN
jgi:large subunit ribosomal protein L10